MKRILTPSERAAVCSRPMKWAMDGTGQRVRFAVQSMLDDQVGSGQWIVMAGKGEDTVSPALRSHTVTILGNSAHGKLCGEYLDKGSSIQSLTQAQAVDMYAFERQFAHKITQKLLAITGDYIVEIPQFVAIYPCSKQGRRYGYDVLLYARLRIDTVTTVSITLPDMLTE